MGWYVLACLVALLEQPCDHARARVVGVERMGQILADAVVLLLERERLKDHRVVFVLQRGQQRRHRRVRRWAREGRVRRWVSAAARRTRLDRQQVVDAQLLARDRVLAVLIDVPLNQTLLKQKPALLRDDRLFRRLARDWVSARYALAQNMVGGPTTLRDQVTW